MMNLFEIYIHDHWCKVNWNIFRSWAGDRRVNCIPFNNYKVFYFGTNIVFRS